MPHQTACWIIGGRPSSVYRGATVLESERTAGALLRALIFVEEAGGCLGAPEETIGEEVGEEVAAGVVGLRGGDTARTVGPRGLAPAEAPVWLVPISAVSLWC